MRQNFISILLSIILVSLLTGSAEMESVEILIIGAGLSGISAASKLVENGFNNLVILEAENRIGGRIHSVDYGSGKLDLGGQWIHGEDGNSIYEMMKSKFDLGMEAFEEFDVICLMSDGSEPNQEKCSRLIELAHKIREKSFDDMKKFNGSFGDFFHDLYTKALNTPEFSDIDQELALMVKDQARRETNSYYACNNWDDISTKLDSEYGFASGNQMITFKDKGYVSAFDFLMKKLPNPAETLDVESKILFNKKVVNIKYSEDPNIKTVVTCSDGSIYNADHVIVTTSLGVLKAHHQTLFTPPLPAKKTSIIESFGFGTIGKIFLEFDEPFWNEAFTSYSLLWQESDVNEIKSTDKAWLLDVVAWIKVDSYPNLIEAFVAGERMKFFEEMTNEKMTDDCMWLLEKFSNKNLPKPTKMFRTKWLTSENFLGTYSYISMGLEKFNGGPKDLAEPLKKFDGKSFLHFAGEATDIEYPSYAHGAVTSGRRAADEIINLYK